MNHRAIQRAYRPAIGGAGTALLNRVGRGLTLDPDRGDGGTATVDRPSISDLRAAFIDASERARVALEAIRTARAAGDETSAERMLELEEEHADLLDEAERAHRDLSIEERDRALTRSADQVRATVTRDRIAVAAERVYYPGATESFVVDTFRAAGGDTAARERMQRHNAVEREERMERARADGRLYRDLASSAFGALIPDVFMTGLYAPLARAGRATANAVRSLPLPPEGNVFKIPRLTTGTAAGVQASENAAITEVDLDETTLTINVSTIAGMQDVSRQVLDRGTSGLDQLILGDLAAAYGLILNTQLLTGTGAAGQLPGLLGQAGVSAITYTDATPTIGELWPKLMDAIQRVGTLRFMPANLIIMHPRRWAWALAALDAAAGRPFLAASAQLGPQNVLGVGQTAVDMGQIVGNLGGLPVMLDPLIPTNLGGGTEDAIIVTRADDLILWEEGGGTPRELRFDQPLANTLTVRMVVYGYAAFTAGRYPAATSIITGTGLIAPTF